jgi:hypothetical protein
MSEIRCERPVADLRQPVEEARIYMTDCNHMEKARIVFSRG